MSDHAVFVTGAGSGIGRAVTARLLSAGNAVFAGVISEQEAAGLGDLSGALTTVQLDVRDAQSVQDAVAVIQAALDGRKLRAVLNIAGVTTNGPLVDLDPSTFTNVLAVNVVGMHTVAQAALPLLAEGGRVVNISSSSGSRTLPFTGAYSASKFAVEALSTAMRMEFAALGIHVSVVAPANIQTPMADRIHQELAKTPSMPVYEEPLRRFAEGAKQSFAHGIPLERVVDALVDAVQADEPQRRYELHSNYFRDVVLMRVLPVGIRESLIRKRLALHPQEVAT